MNDAGLDIDITETSYISSTIEEEEDSDKTSEATISDLSAPEHLIEFKEATKSTLLKGGNKFTAAPDPKKEKAAEEARLKEKRDLPKRKTRDFKMLLVNQEKSKWLETHKFIRKKKPKEVKEVKTDQPLESSSLIRKIVTIGMIKDHKRQSRIEARKSFAFNFEFNEGELRNRNSVFINSGLVESRKPSQISRPSFLNISKS